MKKLCTLFLTFLKIGAFTFGGGYAMVALLENEFIAKKKWIDKKRVPQHDRDCGVYAGPDSD